MSTLLDLVQSFQGLFKGKRQKEYVAFARLQGIVSGHFVAVRAQSNHSLEGFGTLDELPAQAVQLG